MPQGIFLAIIEDQNDFMGALNPSEQNRFIKNEIIPWVVLSTVPAQDIATTNYRVEDGSFANVSCYPLIVLFANFMLPQLSNYWVQ